MRDWRVQVAPFVKRVALTVGLIILLVAVSLFVPAMQSNFFYGMLSGLFLGVAGSAMVMDWSWMVAERQRWGDATSTVNDLTTALASQRIRLVELKALVNGQQPTTDIEIYDPEIPHLMRDLARALRGSNVELADFLPRFFHDRPRRIDRLAGRSEHLSDEEFRALQGEFMAYEDFVRKSLLAWQQFGDALRMTGASLRTISAAAERLGEQLEADFEALDSQVADPAPMPVATPAPAQSRLEHEEDSGGSLPDDAD